MNAKRLFVSHRLGLPMAVLAIILVAAAGAVAVEPGPEGPLTTSFTYQGRLTTEGGGDPIDDSCDFQFALWDDPAAGNQVGPMVTPTGVAVVDGLFTVPLDFGEVFDGTALWLEVAVQCTGDPGYTTLTPRQALTAAPYAAHALQAEDADMVDGSHASAFAPAGHGHWGASWTGTGTGLTLSGGTVGLFATGDTRGVYGKSDLDGGYGVYGEATGSSMAGAGVYGTSASPEGRGVYGSAGSTTGTTAGVYGENISPDGSGVYGHNSATHGSAYGLHGESASPDGYGVYGYTPSTTGQTCGVYGQSASNAGYGVFGYAPSTTGATYGVYGKSDSTTGYGVFGYVPSTTGATYGVYGQSDSTSGRAVYGYASAATGYTYGVYGQSDSENGYGVYGSVSNGVGVVGYASATSGVASGVYGSTYAPYGVGVSGHASSNTGSATGVLGTSSAQDGYGGWFDSTSTSAMVTQAGVYARGWSDVGYGVAGHNYWNGTGVGAWSFTGRLIQAYSGDYPGGTLRFYVTNAGSVYADGTFNSFKQTGDAGGGEYRTLYGMTSAEAWAEDFGSATLKDGKATVTIDPIFSKTVNLAVEYHVYLTPVCSELIVMAVTGKGSDSFTVQGATLDGKASGCAFDYRIVAKQRGYEDQRLEKVDIPEPVEVDREGSQVPGSLEPEPEGGR